MHIVTRRANEADFAGVARYLLWSTGLGDAVIHTGLAVVVVLELVISLANIRDLEFAPVLPGGGSLT